MEQVQPPDISAVDNLAGGNGEQSVGSSRAIGGDGHDQTGSASVLQLGGHLVVGTTEADNAHFSKGLHVSPAMQLLLQEGNCGRVCLGTPQQEVLDLGAMGGTLCPQEMAQPGWQLCSIQASSGGSIDGGKLAFHPAIELGCVGTSEFKGDSQSPGQAHLLELHIFTSTIAADEFNLVAICRFKVQH